MDRRKILLVVAVLVAALGAGLVFVYAQGAEDRAAEKFDTRQVLVATQTILPGERAEDANRLNKLALVDVPADQIVEGSTSDGNLFRGSVAITTIYPGEQLLTQKFGTVDQVQTSTPLTIPPGMRAISIQLSDTGKVGPFTQPGSRVVIYVSGDPAAVTPPTGTQGEDDPSSSITPAVELYSDVLVLAVGSKTIEGGTDADGNPLPETSVAIFTVAVSKKQAATLIGAQESGRTLTFALSGPAAEDDTTDDATTEDDSTDDQGEN